MFLCAAEWIWDLSLASLLFLLDKNLNMQNTYFPIHLKKKKTKCPNLWLVYSGMNCSSSVLRLNVMTVNSSEFGIFLDSCRENWACAVNLLCILLLFTYYSDLVSWIKLRRISNSSYSDLILLSNTQLRVYICCQYKQDLIQIKRQRGRNSSSAVASSITQTGIKWWLCDSKESLFKTRRMLRLTEEKRGISSIQLGSDQNTTASPAAAENSSDRGRGHRKVLQFKTHRANILSSNMLSNCHFPLLGRHCLKCSSYPKFWRASRDSFKSVFIQCSHVRVDFFLCHCSPLWSLNMTERDGGQNPQLPLWHLPPAAAQL